MSISWIWARFFAQADHKLAASQFISYQKKAKLQAYLLVYQIEIQIKKEPLGNDKLPIMNELG